MKNEKKWHGDKQNPLGQDGEIGGRKEKWEQERKNMVQKGRCFKGENVF